MGEYNRILVAVDISDEAVEIAEKASRIAAQNGAELHIVHAIEPLSFAYGGDIPIDFSSIQEEIQLQARNAIARAVQQTHGPARAPARGVRSTRKRDSRASCEIALRSDYCRQSR